MRSRFQLTRGRASARGRPERRRAAWVEADGRLRRLEGVLQPADVSVSRDGRRAVAPASPSSRTRVQLWDLDTSPRPRTATVGGTVNDVALSPDGRWIALAGRSPRVASWPGRKARALGPPPGLPQYSATTFDPDSRQLAAAAFDGKNTTVPSGRWTPGAPTGSVGVPAPDRTFAAHGFTTALAFSHDGKRLVAAQTDGGVYIWDADGSRAPIVLRGHPDGANSAAFSPESNDVVASGGADGTVRVWRLDEGMRSPSRSPAVKVMIRAVALTPDGSGLIAVGSRGARIWSCDFCGSTSDVLAVAQQRATRTLTPDERALFLHDR